MSNISLLWWHLPHLRQPIKSPHDLKPRHGSQTLPKAGDLVRICNLPYAEAALFVTRAVAVLTHPTLRRPLSCHEPAQASAMEPSGSSWEANELTFYGPDMYTPAGRILLSPHCFQIFTSSHKDAKTLREYSEREVALWGLENHLQLKKPNEKAIMAARAFMATLENSCFRAPSLGVMEPDPRQSEGTLPHSTVAGVHDSEASTVPLCRESVAVERVHLHDSTLVRVRGATGGMDPHEHFLPISGLRKGDLIASAEQNEQGGFQLGWATVVCVLAFELRDPQILVGFNGVTMTPPLSSGHAEGGDGETTWVYTCVTTPPSHLIARGPLCRHDNMALLPFNDVYIPTLQRAERQLRNEQWKLLQIGRAQGRQVQAYG